MDSLTQLTFGAACGEAVLGRKVGKKALLWGAFLGTLPDLDVFIPFGGPVNDFVYHRSFSHSLIILCLLSPLIAWMISTIHPNTKQFYFKWVLLCFLVLEGSVILDLLTVYGTQIFWPFDTIPRAIPVLFIIDPLFTLPILSGVLAVLLFKRNYCLGHRLNAIGLTLSLLYLIWAIGAGEFVKRRVANKLDQQGISFTQFISSPAPFTTLLWRVIGIDNDRYFETYYSLFDRETPLFIDFYSRNLELLTGIEEHPPVVKLRKFTRGYFAFSKTKDDVIMTDLRMGSEPNYVFQFKIAKLNDQYSIPVDDERLKINMNRGHLGWLWERIWKPMPQ